MRDTGNRLYLAIQLTVYIPSMNSNNRLPVIDSELSIVQNKVEFIFYKKAVSNPRVMLYSTAISNRIKRDSILQEGYRCIRNCSRGTDESVINEILSSYMHTLRVSGYTVGYRFHILKGISNSLARETMLIKLIKLSFLFEK